jgi:hypothetical protein
MALREATDNRTIQPDQALAALVGLVLIADRPERQRFGYRLKRGRADRDADHGRFWREATDTTLAELALALAAASASPARKAAHSSITGRRLSSVSLRL